MFLMFTKNDFAYFQGTVQQVTVREKVHAATTSGGGFIYRGTGFVAPPSVSIQSHSVQDFWLKGTQGERNFQIFSSNLPMRDGQKITALWLKDHLVAYVNHATNQFLLLEQGLNGMIGKEKAKAAWPFGFSGLAPLVRRLGGDMRQYPCRAHKKQHKTCTQPFHRKWLCKNTPSRMLFIINELL
jgi:hypothetical protein